VAWEDYAIGALLTATLGLVGWIYKALHDKVNTLEKSVAGLTRTAQTLKPVEDLIVQHGTSIVAKAAALLKEEANK